MIRKTILFMLAFWLVSGNMTAEETATDNAIDIGIQYTGELQTDFRGGTNFLNHLRFDATLNISSAIRFNASAISMAQTNESIGEDLQAFSNIEAFDNIPLALAVAGIEWDIESKKGHHTLFVGIRNTGEDYFASDITAFFMNSSCGINPTISLNYPIATFPYSAMCLHYAYDSKHWGAKVSLYNGTGNRDFTGRENIFRVCPESDGVFAMGQIEYKGNGRNYFLGGSLYKDCPVLWTYGEQRIFSSAGSSLSLIAGYSHNFDGEAFCRNFVGFGGRYDVGTTQIGLFTDYADCSFMHEFATELSCKVAITPKAYVMPALHYINGSTENGFMGVVRLGLSL